jgi:tetratricopeptide (TPR) repeat protein
MTGPEAMALGWQYYQLGRFADAEAVYREAVRQDPGNADSWCFLGIACRAQGKLAEAASAYREALRLRPDFVEVLNNLGNVLSLQGLPAEAEGCYRQLLQIRPDYAEAHNNLGVALRNQGRLDEAMPCYREALRLRPQYADAHNNLGDVLASRDRLDEAVASYRQALQLKPDFAQAHTNLGAALGRQGQYDEAAAHHRQALAIWPGYAEAHSNLGNVLAAQGRADEAIACYREALRLKPDLVEAHFNLGIALAEQTKLDDAIVCYHQALRLKPAHVEALGSLGHALRIQGRVDEALACYDRLIERTPDEPEAHMSRALALLSLGDFEEGWREYEWRWKTRDFGDQPANSWPRWDGASLEGRTILLHAEQGLGDTLQFIRYAALTKARGGTVIVVCQKALVPLLAGCPGIDRLIVQGEPLPPFDVQAPLLSLPAILGTTLATIPANVPYVFPRGELVERWREDLDVPGFRVGIAWQGNPRYKADRYRSIPLAQFGVLAGVPGVRLFSLQKGAGSEQVAGVDFAVTDLGPRLDESSGPFLDTAAVMKNLDLVITVETALAHLAGALGVPVWLLLSAAAHFTWLLEREDCPWYPTMRLFRQAQFGQWAPVFERMARELSSLASQSRRAAPVHVEVAPGELLDKITILRIKTERLTDEAKLRNVRIELETLESARHRSLPPSSEMDRLESELKAVNEALWQIEDDIRDCERRGDFGPRFIELARSVYRQNDHRAALKGQINELLGSRLREEKSYTPYLRGAGETEA